MHRPPPQPAPEVPCPPRGLWRPPERPPPTCGRFLLWLPRPSERRPRPLAWPQAEGHLLRPALRTCRPRASGPRQETPFLLSVSFSRVHSSIPSFLHKTHDEPRGHSGLTETLPPPVGIRVQPGVGGAGGGLGAGLGPAPAGENRKPTAPGVFSGVPAFQVAGLSLTHSPLWMLRD